MAIKKSGETDSLSTREKNAWRSYITASRRLLEALDLDLTGHDLSIADYEVLAHLSESPERRMRMSELAELSMISKSRLSHRMKVMEKAGWVKRESCETDKRGSYAVMTNKGLTAISKAAPDHDSSVKNRFIQHLTHKDQEELTRIFNRVTDELREQFLDEVEANTSTSADCPTRKKK
jgi:DNA-binding MarR family transcriptional regulator